MNKVVLDTNVVVSAIFFGGQPQKVLMLVLQGRAKLVLSQPVFQEYERVCQELLLLKGGTDAAPVLAALKGLAHWVKPDHLNERYCEDPFDDMFFECALAAGGCDLVSGDKAVLSARVEGVFVMTPAQYLKMIREE
jgi:putative PIN family toxin of toxin-antitoxin system